MNALDFPTLTTVVSVVTAAAAVAAALASIWSARAARDAAAGTSREARAAILRDLSHSVTAVISRGGHVSELVRRLKLARESQFALVGRNVSAAAPLIAADEEKRAMSDQAMEAARALEMRSFQQCTDDELHTMARNMGSYALRLTIAETDLSGELDRVEAENRERRPRA